MTTENTIEQSLVSSANTLITNFKTQFGNLSSIMTSPHHPKHYEDCTLTLERLLEGLQEAIKKDVALSTVQGDIKNLLYDQEKYHSYRSRNSDETDAKVSPYYWLAPLQFLSTQLFEENCFQLSTFCSLYQSRFKNTFDFYTTYVDKKREDAQKLSSATFSSNQDSLEATHRARYSSEAKVYLYQEMKCLLGLKKIGMEGSPLPLYTYIFDTLGITPADFKEYFTAEHAKYLGKRRLEIRFIINMVCMIGITGSAIGLAASVNGLWALLLIFDLACIYDAYLKFPLLKEKTKELDDCVKEVDQITTHYVSK